MKESVIRHLICISAAILATSGISLAICADAIESKPVLIFRIVNSAEVPAQVLNHAQKHVEEIYRKSGIRIEWLTGTNIPEALRGTRRLELTILLVADRLARRIGRPDQETGFAISTDGQGARRAYVFVGRAERQAEMVARLQSLNKEKADGLILGCAIAHEAGHLMLPDHSHTITGIMRARMDMASVELAMQGRLVFQPEQSKAIQAAMIRASEF